MGRQLLALQETGISSAQNAEQDAEYNTDPLFSRLMRENELAMAAVKTIHQNKILSMNDIDVAAAAFLGRHVLAEFKVPQDNPFLKAINSEAHPEQALLKMLIGGANAAKATILGHHSAQTSAGDIWAIVVIQESHFSLHYRKQENFIAIDAFTCGEIILEAAVDFIQEQLSVKPYDNIEFKRGVYQTRDERFLKGVALLPESASTLHFFQHKPQQTALGQHVIAEFYACDVDRINSVDMVVRAFHAGLDEASARHSDRFTFVHKFSPQGVSAVVCGEDFHLTIHDWPEHGYAAIDLCVFGNKIHPQAVMEKIASLFQTNDVSQQSIPRGAYRFDKKLLTPVFDRYKSENQDEKRLQLKL